MSQLGIYGPGRAPSLWTHRKNGGRIVYAFFSGEAYEYYHIAAPIIEPFLDGSTVHRPRAVMLWIGDNTHAIIQPRLGKSDILQYDIISGCSYPRSVPCSRFI
ncbi:MAG: hypothetical protein AAB360_01315 [Patescibacteria group bacterium]